jgi:nicotinamidase-related amidase
MYEKEALLANLQKLLQGIRILGVPVMLTEQNPSGLGPTAPEISALLPDITAIPKFTFSCGGEPRFMDSLQTLSRKQVLIAGIESHVCVYQTSIDLLKSGYEVQVVADCVSSRTEANKKLSIERMRDEGVKVTGTEMVLFELLKVAEGDRFKAISRLIR